MLTCVLLENSCGHTIGTLLSLDTRYLHRLEKGSSGLRAEGTGAMKMGLVWTADCCRPWQRRTRRSTCTTKRRLEWVCVWKPPKWTFYFYVRLRAYRIVLTCHRNWFISNSTTTTGCNYLNLWPLNYANTAHDVEYSGHLQHGVFPSMSRRTSSTNPVT